VPSIEQPALPPTVVDEPVILLVSFADEDSDDSHSATVDWGDGAIEPGVVDGVAKEVSASHSYPEAGSFDLEVCVEDAWGGSACASAEIEVVDRPIFSDDFESGTTDAWTPPE
jgi:hypothetical protein